MPETKTTPGWVVAVWTGSLLTLLAVMCFVGTSFPERRHAMDRALSDNPALTYPFAPVVVESCYYAQVVLSLCGVFILGWRRFAVPIGVVCLLCASYAYLLCIMSVTNNWL